MSRKVSFIIAFIVLALIQLYVPAQMVWEHESVLKEGKAFNFRTAPIDPNDPFRGKYVQLSYNNGLIPVEGNEWEAGAKVFVLIEEDSAGFARVRRVSKTRPTDYSYYFESNINFINQDNEVSIDYPFDRFYMEESQAPQAEEVYEESVRDFNQVAYASVTIKDGVAVLTDVFINDQSLRDLVD